MNRKSVTALVLVLLMFVQCLTPAALAESTTADCEHVWVKVSTLKEADCTKDVTGIEKWQCSECEKIEYRSTTGHNMEIVSIDATCDKPAMVGEKCKLCGTLGETSVVEGSVALGHELVLDTTNANYKEATCTEGGLDTYKCSRCDYTEAKATVALGHDYDEGVYVDPDCENGAAVKSTCKRCGAVKVEELTGELAVPALGHTEQAVPDVAATCKTTGLTGKVICAVCGKTITEGVVTPVNPDAHVLQETVVKAATCDTTGISKFECTQCDWAGYKVTPAAHSWNAGEVTKAADCGNDGEMTYTCSVCQKTKTEVIPATGEHQWEEKTIDATCTEPAKVGKECKVCGAVTDAVVVEGSIALGHDLVLDTNNENYKKATCAEGGHDTYKCSRCDYTEEKDTEALEHVWDDGEYVDPDCENGAGIKYTCALCNATKVEELTGELAVPALGHKEQTVPEVAATCKDTGLKGKVICSVCGTTITEGEVTPVDENAHVLQLDKVLKAATCTTTGVGKYSCSVCGEDMGYKVIKDGHKWDAGVVTKEATCGEDGEMTYTCSVCQKTKTEVIPATGEHQWEEKTIDATCTEPAKVGKECSVCHAVTDAVVVEGSVALGHDLVLDTNNENYKAATCAEGGHDTYKCSRCDYTEEKDTEALKHVWDDGEYVEASCTHGNGVLYTCTLCGETYVEPVTGDAAVPALEHKRVAVEDIPATCTTTGWTGKVICEVGGEVIEAGEEIPVDANAHVRVPGTSMKVATCKTPGIRRVVCAECGQPLGYETFYLDHAWSEEKVTADGSAVYKECVNCGTKELLSVISTADFDCMDDLGIAHKGEAVAEIPATSEAEGMTAGVVCSVCGKILEGCEVIPVETCKHVAGETVKENEVEANCTTAGSYDEVVYCTLCGKEISRNTITVDPIAHTEEIEIPETPATCMSEGLTAKLVCSVCGETLQEQTVIPMLDHTLVKDAAVAATCTEDGLTEGEHCSVCGFTTVMQDKIPATGHTLVKDAAVAATCTEDGLTEGEHCSACGLVTVAQDKIPATGHTSVKDAAVAATCTEAGLTEGEHCSVCGAVIVAQNVIPAKGHTVVEVNGKAATCAESGKTADKVCSECHVTLEEGTVIPATGAHSFTTSFKLNADATKKIITRTCSICGYTEVVEEDI